MTYKEFETYKVSIKMAKLSIDYLSKDDWAGMLGYIVEYKDA